MNGCITYVSMYEYAKPVGLAIRRQMIPVECICNSKWLHQETSQRRCTGWLGLRCQAPGCRCAMRPGTRTSSPPRMKRRRQVAISAPASPDAQAVGRPSYSESKFPSTQRSVGGYHDPRLRCFSCGHVNAGRRFDVTCIRQLRSPI